jgi:pimeloyl-[acyl-carrier protein] methyl ester esterase
MGESALVFVHGWSANSGAWFSQVEFFKRDYRVILIDLPGHGGAPVPPGAPVPVRLEAAPSAGAGESVKNCGVELARLLEREKINSAHLVGWSLGAQVVCHAALADGSRIKSLVSVGGTPCFVAHKGEPWGLPDTKAKMFQRMMRQDFKKGFTTFVNSFFDHEKNFTSADETLLRGILLDHPPDPVWATTMLEDFHKADIRPLLGLITTPLFDIHGGLDRISPPGAVELWKAAPGFQNAAILPERGHAPFLTAPEEFNETLNRFLTRL